MSKSSYDYIHAKKLFVIRMGSPFHESFLSSVSNRISRWLDNIKEGDIKVNDTTLDIVKGLNDMGSPNVDRASADKEIDTNHPDRVFCHEDCECQSMIIEVIWSHGPITPDNFARQYIGHSKGDTRTFICVDMKPIYLKRKNATASFSVYRADFSEDSNWGGVTIENTDGDQVCKP